MDMRVSSLQIYTFGFSIGLKIDIILRKFDCSHLLLRKRSLLLATTRINSRSTDGIKVALVSQCRFQADGVLSFWDEESLVIRFE